MNMISFTEKCFHNKQEKESFYTQMKHFGSPIKYYNNNTNKKNSKKRIMYPSLIFQISLKQKNSFNHVCHIQHKKIIHSDIDTSIKKLPCILVFKYQQCPRTTTQFQCTLASLFSLVHMLWLRSPQHRHRLVVILGSSSQLWHSLQDSRNHHY